MVLITLVVVGPGYQMIYVLVLADTLRRILTDVPFISISQISYQAYPGYLWTKAATKKKKKG